jgi:hypothetical protein
VCFIDVFSFYIFDFYVVTSDQRLLFESRTNVFLSGKAEIAVKTRQVFLRTPRGSTIWLGAYPQPILDALEC